MEDKVLKEIEERILLAGLEINVDTIRIMANIMMDEEDPLPNGKPRNITYITGIY